MTHPVKHVRVYLNGGDDKKVANISAMIKECTKPHVLAHSVAGVGIGLLVVGLVPSIAANAVVIGIVLVVVGIIYDMMVNKP